MTSDQISTCPDKNELRAFAFGDLSETRFEELAKHIDECKPCGMVVDDASRHHQSGLVTELRSLNVPSTDLGIKHERHGLEVPETLLKVACEAADLFVDTGFV